MKYVILLGDGMADYPIPELGGATVLEAAHTPAMDRIAAQGVIGLIDTIPSGCAPGSDVANMTILGYDPRRIRAGRGALEAVAMGVVLSPGGGESAFRCNLVTLSKNEAGQRVMEDFTAGHISSEEAAILVRHLDHELGGEGVIFRPGVGYRNLMIWKGAPEEPEEMETTPPHDITGKVIYDYLPRGRGSEFLQELIDRSMIVLADHPVNRERVSRGDRPAASIWPWGQGGAPRMKKLTELYGISGAMISAVDLLKGIGICAGLEVLPVQGATGYVDTNYRGKAERALEWLEKGDFIFLHVEAPDEMGHEGNVKGKIKAIENFDEMVVARVLEGLESSGYEYRIMVLSDHATPIKVGTHVSDPSPFAVLSSRKEENRGLGCNFGEKSAVDSRILVSPGYILMEYFVGNWRSFIDRF